MNLDGIFRLREHTASHDLAVNCGHQVVIVGRNRLTCSKYLKLKLSCTSFKPSAQAPQKSHKILPQGCGDYGYCCSECPCKPVELNRWVKVMARRIEAQVSRDWVWGFTTWNLLFRSALNLSRATDAYLPSFFDEETQDWAQPTGKHVEQAAQQLLLALKGSYIDVTGQPRPVKGDVSKLRYVQGPKPIARQLLTNMRHTDPGLH